MFPAELVDEAVDETGRGEKRSRLLPVRVTVYFVLAMGVFSGQAYEEVARLLAEGLAWSCRWRGNREVPLTGAISRARARLGPELLRAMFARVRRPVATQTPSAPGIGGCGWWRWTAPCWMWRTRRRMMRPSGGRGPGAGARGVRFPAGAADGAGRVRHACGLAFPRGVKRGCPAGVSSNPRTTASGHGLPPYPLKPSSLPPHPRPPRPDGNRRPELKTVWG
ncbi:transposase domain-containing protein [Streptomyces mirabilis]|uniref:transposase domain-containing protein n=1 Tax=Streptomyces mirabilis TaxID=68239 RepID=UPI0036579987